MATRQHVVDFILEQMSGVTDASARKMFGEYAIYSKGKVVALVCDDQLFVKPTDAGKNFVGKVTEGAPYPGAKPWVLVAGDKWEDGDWLSELIRLTAQSLPVPKPNPAPSRAAKVKKLKAKGHPAPKVKAKPQVKKKNKA